MKRFRVISGLMIVCVFAMNAIAADLPQRALGNDGVFTGGCQSFSKTQIDTVVLMGPWSTDAPANGQFQDRSGNPAWNGWTHWDPTRPTVTHWQVSEYNAGNLPGGFSNLAAFCGDETIPPCSSSDPVGGYGNNWHEILEFSFAVDDKFSQSTMQVSGVFNSNTEPGYDYVTFQFVTADGYINAATFDGVHEALSFSYSQSYVLGDYVGENNDEVRFRIQFISDGGWSDEDCDYTGNGALQVDDLRVQCTNGNCDVFTDFEDGTLGDWYYVIPLGVGDFTDLWVGLTDIDPCRTNNSPQVAFIDDGTKVPGVGPSYCENWCYGIGGYIVNTTGGAQPGGRIFNLVESPILRWPENEYTGAELSFDVYRHEDLTADAPWIFYTWNVRSTSDEVNLPIGSQSWRNRNFVHYGGPEYLRESLIVSDLLVPGATHVQVQLECIQLGLWKDWQGDDGYPAPYFDNVRVTAFQTAGPDMSAREINLAQDNFKELEEPIDLVNLESNFVRFDSAMNNAVGGQAHNTPGDSISVNISPSRAGAELVSSRLVYTMKRNPVFDSARNPGWGSVGSSEGKQEETNRYSFDLPDSGFLFPGDILHYYIEATETVERTEPRISTLPADTTGFGNFFNPIAYHSSFQVHALPSVNAQGDQPSILFWNDNANRGGQDEWYSAFNNLGMVEGEHYDVYYTNGPSSGVGNGLGGRAALANIDGYTKLLYTSGDLGSHTISSGDPYSDPSCDTELLLEWFNSGEGRNAFFCGDNLAYDMSTSGSLNNSFVTEIMNVEVEASDMRLFINQQTTPAVLPEAGNSVFSTTPGWIAYGGCFGLNAFDGVVAGEGAERLARFTNPNGVVDYDFSAITLNTRENDRIITLPYDFMSLYTDPNNLLDDGVATRVNILHEILTYFQVGPQGVPTDVPDLEKFSVSSYPNPFNPTTRLAYTMPKEGHLTLKVYNVRGELVKTLIDEIHTAGSGHIMWDGTNSQDAQVASGIYFYEARTGGEVVINKMALVK